MDIRIQNATLIPMTKKGLVIRGGSVLIRSSRIAEITQSGEQKEKEGMKVIDGRRLIILPGLINAHVHLFQTLLRGKFDNLPLLDWLRGIYASAKALTVKDCYYGALIGCLESIRSGTTTLVDHHFLYHDPEIADAILSAFKETKVRGILVRGMMDEGEWVAPEAKQPHEVIFKHCDDLLSRYSKEMSHKKIAIWVGPNTPGINCSPGLISGAKQFAKAKGIRISTHIAENDGIVQQTKKKFGFDGVVEFLHHLNFLGEEVLGAHCVRVNPDEMDILSQTGTKVVHNPVSNMFLGDGVAPIAQMLKKGITVSLGTDSTAANNSQDMFEVMKTTTLLQRVTALDPSLLPPWDVLELATVCGAKCVGLSDEVGTLEPGKRADLIGIDLSLSPHAVAMHSEVSQIVHCARPSDVKLVMIDGEIVMEGGTVRTADEEQILREGQKIGESLVSRI